jgi:hypothetical protein
MSALDELFAVLLTLYVYESLWCVPAGAWLFVARGLGGLRDVRRTWVEGGALEFVRAPLLRRAPQFVALSFLIALAPEGSSPGTGRARARAAAARGARWIARAGAPFQRTASRAHRAAVVARFDSAGAAEAFARRLTEIAAKPAEQRSAAIHGWIAERLGVAAAKTRFAALASATAPLRVAVAALFAVLAIALPVAAYRWGLVVVGPWLLVAWLLPRAPGWIATWRFRAAAHAEPQGRRLAPASPRPSSRRRARIATRHTRGALRSRSDRARGGRRAGRDAVARSRCSIRWPLILDVVPTLVPAATVWYHAAYGANAA